MAKNKQNQYQKQLEDQITSAFREERAKQGRNNHHTEGRKRRSEPKN